MFFQMADVYEKDKRLRRAGQAPRELPQALGRAGRTRPPGPRALPARRDGVEGLVPEGVRGRRLPRDQARHGHGPPEGPRRPQQEAQEGQEAAREGAHAVRPAHQVEDHRSSTATRPQAAKAQEHFAAVLKIWNKGAAASKITGKDVEARAGLGGLRRRRLGLLHGRGRSTRTSCASSSPRASTSSSPPATTRAKKAAAKKKKAEESGKKFTAYLDEKAKALDKARDAVPRRLRA